jgi:GTPase KRas protein
MSLDTYELEEYCDGRYCEVLKGCEYSLQDCVIGLTLTDLSGFTKAEFVALVKEENGPWKIVGGWLVKERPDLPQGKMSLEQFLRPSAEAPLVPPVAVTEAASPPSSEWRKSTAPTQVSPREGAGFLSRRSPSPTRRGTTTTATTPTRPTTETPESLPEKRQPVTPGRGDKKEKKKKSANGSLFETVVVGGGAVGKSALTIMYIQEHFVDVYDPTVEDSYRRGVTLELEGEETAVVLSILDTAGQEEYSAMREQYMQSGEGFLIVYDITSRDSFDEIETFYEQVIQVKDQGYQGWVPIVLIGNKSDLFDDREVTPEEGEAMARRWGVPFYETSALTGEHVKDAYQQLIREIWKFRCLTEKDDVAKPGNKCAIL